MMIVLGSSRVLRVIPIEDSLRCSKYDKRYVHLDRLDKLFAMVFSDSSLEILLYDEILHILKKQVRTIQLVELIRINPYNTTFYIISDLFLR
jgi:hypothetical protein